MTARRDGHFWTLLVIGVGLLLIVAAWVLGAQRSEHPGGRQGVHTPGSPHGAERMPVPK